MHVFHYVSSMDGCAILVRTADEVSPVQSSQLETLEETLKFSNSLPVSFRSTEEATRSAEALLKSIIAFGRIETAMADVVQGVQKT